jgi:hypothetical protein
MVAPSPVLPAIGVPTPAVQDLDVPTVTVPALFETVAPATNVPVTATPPTEDLQRKEREVSMAELARDIMSISDHEYVPVDRPSAARGVEADAESPAVAELDTVAPLFESDRQASADLMIGPARKGGLLRRSKGSPHKDTPDDSEGFDPMNELGTSPEPEPAEGKARSRRLRLR